MSATNSLHYELCCKGATWIRQRNNAETWKTPNALSVVEIVCYGAENPDIYATNGCESTVIEVKTSHTDFLADQKKFSRTHTGYAMGDFRYYLCPEGIIKPEELPADWGLLYYCNGKIRKVVQAKQQKAEKLWDLMLLSSILRREGIWGKTLNYRQNAPNFEDNPKNCEK